MARTNPLAYLLRNQDEPESQDAGGVEEPDLLDTQLADPGLAGNESKVEDPTPDQPGGLSKPTAQPADAPTATPATTYPTPDANDPVKSQQKALEAQMVAQALGSTPGGTSSNAELVDKAPAWYKPLMGPPPTPKNPLLGNLAQVAIASQGKPRELPRAFLRGRGAPLPERRVNDQSAEAGMLGQAVGNAINRDVPTEQYKANLGAAEGQAKMLASLRNANGAAKPGNPAEALRYLNDRSRLQDAEAKAAEAARVAAALNDPNSPETAQERQASVEAGLVTPDQANRMSGKMLRDKRVNLAQNVQRDWRSGERDRAFDMSQNAAMSKEERAQEYQLAQEQRKQQDADSQGYIPGRNFVTGHAPAPAQVTEAKKVDATVGKTQQALDQLIADNEKLQTVARTGAWYNVFGPSEDQKRVLARMKANHFVVQNGIREIGDWGTPQAAEFKKSDVLNPPPDTIQGWASSQYQYPALREAIPAAGATKLKSLGYGESDTNAPGLSIDKPIGESVIRHEKPAVHKYKSSEAAPSLTETSGAAPAQTLYVAKNGNNISKPRAMTPAFIEHLKSLKNPDGSPMWEVYPLEPGGPK